MSYREYFDIDPQYFPQVDKKIIDTQPDLWKKFYPHPSFVKMLKATLNVLKRTQKLSIWVDGAYGTGKSHAVLTLKKLIEASVEDTNAYFAKYKLDDFMCKEFNSQKNSGKIVVCHRYGSSDINNDTDLILAIQESVEKALEDNEIENKASASIKNALVRYFQNEENKQSFNVYAKGTYKDTLGGDNADSILKKLQEYQDDSLRSLISKIFKVPAVKGSFSLNTTELCEWITEVIEKNDIYHLIFMWDEFSEYFENNMRHLTGFQEIAELSATRPFTLMIVTHKAEGYFSDGDPDKRKILDRFIPPVHIELPENIAFELMAQAMKVTEDEALAAKWIKHKASLDRRTMNSRTAVKNKIGLTDKNLSDVLPIHPYAALLLQHISVYYTSTARSMFNFIKNDEGTDVKAFQWFINNYDFNSQCPFVTIDLLWSFFYEHGQDKLASGIREVLSCYTSRIENQLLLDERRVLKTILLLQAVSERMSGKKDIFLPNDANLSLAFEGTDLELKARNIANKLLNDHVVTRTPLTGDVFSYCCKNIGPSVDAGPFMDAAKSKSTKDLTFMQGTELRNVIELGGPLRLRYNLSYATLGDFDGEIKKANNPSEISNKLYAVATIAKDLGEQAALQKKIKSFYEANPASKVVVIDTSTCVLDTTEYNAFVENYAMALAIGQSDMTQRKTYESYALEVLKTWAKRIKTSDYYVYSTFSAQGTRVANASDLHRKLMEINRLHYPKCLESEYVSVVNTMFDATSMKQGALCGICEETKGTFRSGNEATKLENALSGAWKVANYWETSNSYISSLKKDVDDIINKEFAKTDRISIAKIYQVLKEEPYAFMPCNLTAFILGFVLKEYANDIYSYSDNLTTIPLDSDRLAEMIAEILKQDNTPDKRYKDKYIVTLTDDERAFNKATSKIFGIEEKYCVSITDTRSKIREKMKGYTFPIWVIKYAIDGVSFKTSKDLVCSVIDNYCGIANNKNLPGEQSDTDIALAIGKTCIAYPEVIDDVASVLSTDNCKTGMQNYLKIYKNDALPTLAKGIGDGGQYINHLAYKFSSDAANWVWNKDTVNAKIDELITEYEIIDESNKILSKNTNYQETMRSWLSKLDQIRVAYLVIKNDLGEAKPFYEMLYNFKKAGSLLESQRSNFLSLLRISSGHFKDFLLTQHELCAIACKSYLEDISLEELKSILEDDRYGFKASYGLNDNVYLEKLQKAIKAYKNALGYTKLKKHWETLTNTTSPREWSERYGMPILAMVPSDEVTTARKVFETINNKNVDETAITDAEIYIGKMSYLPELNCKASRDKAFIDCFIKEYAVLFDDIDKVKEYLRSKVVEHPYYWLGSLDVERKIKSMAKAKYDTTGYNKAKTIIDDMPADQLKVYLKQLIQDNIVVGVEIMKGKK